ncbi:pyridoxamine 5'-phosphate oxidase [Streptococcus sanguinis]|nr:pyridoxamine 5'-phosphate oxidase [Streptococcus sanguinis]
MNQYFKTLLAEQTEMALATSVKDMPNVRIVNFYYDEEAKKLLFISFKNSQKIQELATNNRIALTTIPKGDGRYIRIQGRVKESQLAIKDIRGVFVQKYPYYQAIIEQHSNSLQLFEVSFSDAFLVLDNNQVEKIKL